MPPARKLLRAYLEGGTREADRVVDGGIDLPLLRKFSPDAKDEDLLKPAAIADAFWYLAHQDRSAWTHELDVRPFKEKF
jgi:hypothetical protein